MSSPYSNRQQHRVLEDAIAVSDGIALYSELHRPADQQKPIGTIVLVHGLGEHLGRYSHIFDILTHKGYQILAYDQRGHGRSGGARVHVEHFSNYSSDLTRVVERAQKFDLPIFLLGHSMGALVILSYLNKVKQESLLRAAVFIGMPIKPHIETSILKETLGLICSWAAPKTEFFNELDVRYLARNEGVGKAYLADPLVHRKVTAGWYGAFTKTVQTLPQKLSGIQVPGLFLHGGDDHIAHPDGSRVIFQAYPSLQKQLHIYEGCYHELLNEDCYPGILDEIHQWYQQAAKNHALAEQTEQQRPPHSAILQPQVG